MSESTSSVLRSDHRIFVAGHRGMVGSALVRRLEAEGYQNLVLRTHAELELTDPGAVDAFFAQERIDHVVLAAAKAGGIQGNNTYPAQFIHQNLAIETTVVHAAHRHGINRLLFLGSSCIYPRLAPQPIPEEALLTGVLESTNEPYAIAKIAGIKLCESYNRQYGTHYRSVMPTNLYGPNDDFDLETSHVVPALIRKFHEAKLAGAETVEIWGSGQPRREFLHVDDVAHACLFVMGLEDEAYASVTEPMLSHLNVGSGTDLTIKALAGLVSRIVGFEGSIAYNTDMPDGTPQKLLSIERIEKLGWHPTIGLEDGLTATYRWYLEKGGAAVA